MIELNETFLIGEGCDKLCYFHPENKNQCIKILKKKQSAEKRIIREMKALTHLQRKKNPPSYISYCREKVETSLGIGYVFDYIKPAADTLEQLNGEILKTKIEELYARCLKDAVILTDMHLDNFILAENGKMHIIDGLGCGEFIPICYWSKFFARAKIKRKFDKLLERLEKRTNGWTQPAIKNPTKANPEKS